MTTGPRHIGKYELHTRLGRGGMAEVWKALDPHLQRFVALKILHADLQNDPDFIKRFEREARAVASLRHPNIVQVHDFQISRLSQEEGSTAYMVMEYVEGMTLTEYIHNTSYQGRFPAVEEIIHLFTSISWAIDYAHQCGMIHRDIKPANILLDKRNPSRYEMGEPILTDFGIVKLLGASTGTLSGSWMGTPAYISPEQAQGHSGDERSDIYSLGIILYEICTGVRPFQDDNVLATIWHHINTSPTSPSLVNPRVPEALSGVILRSLAKDPTARFPSASDMARAITWAFTGSTSQISIPSTHITSEETHANLRHINLLPGSTPSSPAQSIPGYSSPVPTVGLSTPRFAVFQTPSDQGSSARGQNTPVSSTEGVKSVKSTSSLNTTSGLLPDTVLLPSSPVAPRRLWKRRLALFIALLCTILISSSLGAYYIHQKSSGPTLPVDRIVGQAVFFSSGQSSVSSSQGLFDQLQIDLHNIQAPAVGKSYYAWLVGAKPSDLCPPSNTISSILIGKLTVDHGNVHLRYKGVAQHSNLLGIIGGILITEERTSTTPTSLFPDTTTQRYSAQLPQDLSNQVANPTSDLEVLRCLLFDHPSLVSQGIHGGWETQFFKNIKQVLDATTGARNALISKDTGSIRRQILLTLEYIDGFEVFKTELPGKLPPQPDDLRAQIGLISLQKSVGDFSDYADRVYSMLTDILVDPGVTPDTQKHAEEARQSLSNVLTWLQEVHSNALQLVNLPDQQLLQPSAEDKLNAMLTNARYAYSGQVDPSSGILRSGVSQIDDEIQSLTNFDIKPVQPLTVVDNSDISPTPLTAVLIRRILASR